MRSVILMTTGAVLAIGTMATAGDGRLPGTLNFKNETSRINQEVPELSDTYVKEVTSGDIDNDGDLDVVVAAAGGVFGNRRNKLYRNDAGVFNEISGSPVIPGFTTQDLSRHAFIQDYDADNWNDIVIVNDDLGGGGPVKIYMNNGAGTVFTEEHATRGLSFEASCGASSWDWDQDGDLDIYSGNYPGPSQDALKRNDGTAHFTTITSTHVPPDGDYTIDVATADMNGDGKMDLLITNDFDGNYIYYNDLNGLGSEVGDFNYGAGGLGGRQSIGSSGDGAMEPGDFNNDGMMDFYWTNKSGSAGDRILVNTGNDGSGKATFSEVLPPTYATTSNGNKISVADLNQDGRVDVVVGIVSGRPAVLRNTSVNGAVSFVDWTPASAFPTSTTHKGHHGGVFDTNNDGDLDIFFGGDTNDHLFENTLATEVDESDLGPSGGALPTLWNSDPVAVLGHGSTSDVDEYTYGVTSTISNAFTSVIVNGEGDYRLEMLNPSGSVIATSDRGGAGVEEAFQATTTTIGTYTVRVTVLEGGAAVGDVDGDGAVGFTDLLAVLSEWGPCPGCPEDVDGDGTVGFSDVLLVLANWGSSGSGDYILEVLGRRP